MAVATDSPAIPPTLEEAARLGQNLQSSIWAAEVASNILTTSVSSRILAELIPRTTVKLGLRGAKCWQHRNKPGVDCRMKQAEETMLSADQLRADHIIIIHHNSISIAPHPFVYCSVCRAHNEAHNHPTRCLSAVKQGRAEWPVLMRNSTYKSKLWRLSPNDADDNYISVFDEASGAFQPLYKMMGNRYVTEAALVEASNHIWDRHKASPGVPISLRRLLWTRDIPCLYRD